MTNEDCHCAQCSRYRNDLGVCLWCNSRPGELRVEQTRTNYGLLQRLRGLVNFGLAGMVTARLPICEACAKARA